MKFILQRICLFSAALLVASCQGGSNSAASGTNNNIPSPSGVTPSVNIGNITTIPLGQGSSGQSTVTVTNNLSDKLILTKATYTVTQNGVTSAAITATTAGSAITVSQCATVSPHGTCSLAITPPKDASQAQYVLNMEYFDSTTGQTYSLSNMVSFSELIPATDTGVRYSSLNNNVYNVPGNNTTITIPFQLTKDFSSLKVSSNNSNPVFAPTISCPGNTYSAGTLCNLYVTVSGTGTNPLIAGGVTVSGTPLASTAKSSTAKSLKSSLKGEVSYLFGVPITVSQNIAGNLITSAINVGISPSNGMSPQTVTLLNNGSATITNIKVVGATPVSITPDGCSTLSSGLAVGEQCSFDVDVNSPTSGQSTVTVSYNNGATEGNQTGLLVFNVVYIAGASSPGLTITSGQGSLNNVPQNTTQFYNVVVNNTGDTTLNNIRFTNPNSQNAAFSWASGSCNTSGTQSLDAGESCTLVLQYSPTSVASSSTLYINAVGTWTGQSGTPQTYAASTLGVGYSSVTGDAFVYVTPNYVSYAIRADGQDTATQTFKVVNGGIQPTTLDSISIAPGVTGFTSTGSGAGYCTLGQTLAVNESCVINTIYGPTSTIMTNVESQINVAYKPNGGYTYYVWAFSNLVFNSSQAALVTISDITVNGATGEGTVSNPYSYVNTPDDSLHIAITYTNTGTADAESFNVALNNLPIGYKRVGGNCGTGITISPLVTGSSCSVELLAVSDDALYNPYNLSGQGLSFNIPGFSYKDANTGLNNVQSPTWSGHYDDSNRINVTTTLFATVSTPPYPGPIWATAAAGGTNNFTFTGTNGVVIAIPTDQLNGFTVGNSGKCTITGGSCSIPITNVANFPSGINYFSYYVAPAGTSTPSATNSIIQQASFTLN